MQIAGLIARTGLGVVTDSWFGSRKQLVLVGLGIAGAIGYLPLAFLSASTPMWLIVVISGAVGAVALGYNGVYLTIASELASDDETGVATAIGTSAVMIGAVTFPPLFGAAVDIFGSYSLPFGVLSAVMLCAGLAAAYVDTDYAE